ncbi:MAG: L-histidine N(alpha)-methyltransferase [candidate division Zixibacteria bacterium]|nr:L-histidine N(alpha)-methyltransferase [candidate division Zixibacteria bacterium]
MAQDIHTLLAMENTHPDYHKHEFAESILTGLTAKQKYIPAEYHYDAEGSRLFDRITELPEYYITKCEIDALRNNRDIIAEFLGEGAVNIIEFGPGDGKKTRSLVDHFLKLDLDFRYVAVDISHSALTQLADDYRARFPKLDFDCLVSNYASGLKWLNDRYGQRNLVLFLGSSIGNFSREQTDTFLKSLHDELNAGDLALIGFDLVKDEELIRKAYNDAQNVTSEFNLNLLRRINRELAGNFHLDGFRYTGRYSHAEKALKSYLISLKNQEVEIDALQKTIYFERDEAIHTEDSRKYSESDIERLANRNGFSVMANLYDSKRYFVDSIWEVRKPIIN